MKNGQLKPAKVQINTILHLDHWKNYLTQIKYFADIKEKQRLDIAAGKDYHRVGLLPAAHYP